MWRNHPFSQRNKTIERAVGVGVEGNREDGGVGQNLKKRGVGNIGGVNKIGGLGPHLATMHYFIFKKFLTHKEYLLILGEF